MARTYCDGVASGALHPVHTPYHDTEYGFPVEDEAALLERLVLEIHQAGLSWELILRKRDGYRIAFDGFDPERVAAYDDARIEEMALNPGIVRNRAKIRASVHNARVIVGLRDRHGGFSAWLEAHHPLSHPEWVALFRRTFRFMGPEIVGEFLMSTGYLPGAHEPECPVHARAIAAGAAWARDLSGADSAASPR